MGRGETSLGPSHDGATSLKHIASGPSGDSSVVDYTRVPIGWRIKGHLVTGHRTKSTIRCLKCGRVGLLATDNRQRIVVHRGRASDNTLHALDYCELGRRK
jgi:hypothetical protein